MSDRDAILLMGEAFPECPTCGKRLIMSDNPVDQDEDGPIYAGVCTVHGTFLLQDDPEEEGEEDGDD